MEQQADPPPQQAELFSTPSSDRASMPTDPSPALPAPAEAVVSLSPLPPKPSSRRKAAKAAEKPSPAGAGAAPGESGEAGRRPPATLTAFTVQCALCLKWRRVPTLETYEGIRARIGKQPFTCEQAMEWLGREHAPVSCSTPPDLVQDGSLLWAMDRQDIPQPPPNWRRRIVVRGGTSNKFSDVYYHSPCGKSLRSMNDVERFLAENPEYVQQGVTTKRFSFASPRPLAPNASPRTSAGKGRKSSTDATPAGEVVGISSKRAAAAVAEEHPAKKLHMEETALVAATETKAEVEVANGPEADKEADERMQGEGSLQPIASTEMPVPES